MRTFPLSSLPLFSTVLNTFSVHVIAQYRAPQVDGVRPTIFQLGQRLRRQSKHRLYREQIYSDTRIVSCVPVLYFGPMNVICPLGTLRHWLYESMESSNTSSACCHHGRIVLPNIPDYR